MTPDEVQKVKFGKPPLGQRGYDEDVVDQLLDRVEDALRGARGMSRHELATAASALPNSPMGKRGYRKETVDAFMQRVLAEMGLRTKWQVSSPATAGDPRPNVGDTRTPWQGPNLVAAGDHRPNIRMACVYALLWASFAAALVGMNVDFLVVTLDSRFGEPDYVASVSRIVVFTGASVAVTGALVIVAFRHVVAPSLVWDKGGLAYREWAKRQGAIAWRDVTSIHAMDDNASFVVIKAKAPELGPKSELVIGTSGKRSWGRWSMWSYSQEGLIEVLERSRAAAATSRFPPPPPPPPPAPLFLRVLITAWLPLAALITAAVYAADRGSNFALQNLFWNSKGGGGA